MLVFKDVGISVLRVVDLKELSSIHFVSDFRYRLNCTTIQRERKSCYEEADGGKIGGDFETASSQPNISSISSTCAGSWVSAA